MTDKPKSPEAWLEKYNAYLAEGRGLTAREWDHYDELKRTVAALHMVARDDKINL